MGNRTGSEPSPPDGSENRRELARDRTDWALHRTVFARERTVSAWLRTALATVAAGLAIARLIRDPVSPLFAILTGGTFVAAGVAIFIIALWRYFDGYRELKEAGGRIFPLWGMGVLVAVFILGSLAALFLVIWTE